MASVPGKAEKWFNETRKHLKRSIKGRHVKYEKGMEVHTCTYCPKAFSDTRCLVMHVLRRHSDNLVLLHRNIINYKNPEESDLLPADIVKCIQTEFGDLKNELHLVKEIVLEFLSSNSKCQEFQSSPSVINDLKSHSLSKSADTIQEVSSEGGLKSIQKSCEDNNCTDFESKLHDLFETYKKDVILKDIRTEIAVNKKEILQEVKSSLQHEMRNMALHMDKSISELKKSDSELKRELLFLTELVKSNTEKINSLEASPNVEERFEQHLQSFLNSGSLYDDKKKTKPHSKTASHKQRKKKSIFTMTSKGCNNSRLHHSQNEIPNTDDINLSKQQVITYASNPNDKVSEENNKFDLSDIKNIVDEKLKSYNIDPNVEKLTTEEFQKKMCLLKTETEMLGNSVDGFSKVRDDLDSQVNKIARSYMKAKCPKKLRFSDSLRQSSPVLNKSSEVSVMKNTVSEKEVLNYMSPVELAEDYFAQGDCPQMINKYFKNSDEIKLSPKPAKDAELGTKPKFQNSASCMVEVYDKEIRENTLKEAVKLNPSTSHNVQGAPSYGGSMQNFEDLSELSSLSDLED